MSKTNKSTYITQEHYNKCEYFIKDGKLSFKGDSYTVTYDACSEEVDISQGPQDAGIPKVSTDCGEEVCLKNKGEVTECFSDVTLVWRYTCKESGECPEDESPWELVKAEYKESTEFIEGENITIDEVEGDCGEKTITISSIDTDTNTTLESSDGTITITETTNEEGAPHYDISKVCPPDTNTQNTVTVGPNLGIEETENEDGTKNYHITYTPQPNPCDGVVCPEGERCDGTGVCFDPCDCEPPCETTCLDPSTYCPDEIIADGCGGECPTGTKDCSNPCDMSICDIGLIESNGDMDQMIGPFTHGVGCQDPVTIHIGFNNLVITDKLDTIVNGNIVDTSSQQTSYFTTGVSNLYNTSVVLQPGDTLEFNATSNSQNSTWGLIAACDCMCASFEDNFSLFGAGCNTDLEVCGNSFTKCHPVCTHPGGFSIGSIRGSSGTTGDAFANPQNDAGQINGGSTAIPGTTLTYITDNGECSVELQQFIECSGPACTCESFGTDTCVEGGCAEGFECSQTCSSNVCSMNCVPMSGGG